jgi:predicted DNA-binding transcriptional regulator AlpA
MQTAAAPLVDPDALYRLPDLIGRRAPETGKRSDAIVPVSPATIYRWVESGEFPPPLRLGSNIVAWRGSAINAWLASKEPA